MLPPLISLVSHHASATPIVEGQSTAEHLHATYFDTKDHRLTRAELALSKRTGGTDEGWQVDVAAATGGHPVRLPLDPTDSAVPAALLNLVWASTRGETLEAVARISIERTTHRLIDATGRAILELSDDRVQAERAADPSGAKNSTVSWRSLTVELRTEEREWLNAVVAGLRDVGVRKPDRQHDLTWVRENGRAPASGEDRRGAAKRRSPDSPAGDVVLRYVSQQVEQIIASDPLVRLDSPGSVHRMRVATRRLRSALQTFQPVLKAEVVEPLRAELKWLAGVLGGARDAEVLRDRMLAAMQEEYPLVHARDGGNTVDADMAQAYRAAHDALLEALDSGRYHELVLTLHRLVTEPPLTAKANRKARRVLPRRAARAFARLDELVATARKAHTFAERDAQLHEARKAAKKARYAGETLTKFFGRPAARFAETMEKLQEELGEHQDSVVMRERLEELARSEINPAQAFAYGRLHAHEERRGELAIERFEDSWRKARKKSLHAWTH